LATGFGCQFYKTFSVLIMARGNKLAWFIAQDIVILVLSAVRDLPSGATQRMGS